MQTSSTVRTKHTFRAGEVWTASGHFAVDAVVVRITWEMLDATPHPERVTIEEVHELNVARKRHNRHTGISLRRSADQFRREGIMFLHEKNLYTVQPPHVHIHPKFRIRAFVIDAPSQGPFHDDPQSIA